MSWEFWPPNIELTTPTTVVSRRCCCKPIIVLVQILVPTIQIWQLCLPIPPIPHINLKPNDVLHLNFWMFLLDFFVITMTLLLWCLFTGACMIITAGDLTVEIFRLEMFAYLTLVMSQFLNSPSPLNDSLQHFTLNLSTLHKFWYSTLRMAPPKKSSFFQVTKIGSPHSKPIQEIGCAGFWISFELPLVQEIQSTDWYQ